MTFIFLDLKFPEQKGFVSCNYLGVFALVFIKHHHHLTQASNGYFEHLYISSDQLFGYSLRILFIILFHILIEILLHAAFACTADKMGTLIVPTYKTDND